MSKATMKAHQRGLKNTLLWEGRTPETAEDFYAYGVYLEDLYQEREAAIWYRKAAERGHVPDLERAQVKGCQDAVWELWRQFQGNFSEFPFQRDYTEAWSFRLGRYLRAAETAPCKEYYLRLSRFYEQGFPGDSEENRLKMQRFAKEYADQAEHME